MLGSFGNNPRSRSRGVRDDEVEAGPSSALDIGCPYTHQCNLYLRPSPVLHTRQMLLTVADLISHTNFSAAHHLLSALSAKYNSPYGDSTDRLAYHFCRALSIRLGCHLGTADPLTSFTAGDPRELQSCYFSLNQVIPFVRFSHLTANQTILDAINGCGQGHQRSIHIFDFDIMHGVQWPPLMQAMADRTSPPTRLRITGAGSDLDSLNRTGDHLSMFAHSLGLPFHFHPLHIINDNEAFPLMIPVYPNEIVAVNLVMHLHRLIRSDREARQLRTFLHRIRSLNPRIVTVAEYEASHNHPSFLRRFAEALDHYEAVFGSLEATLPPNSRERITVETIWFGREIADIVAAEGDGRRERHERFESWEILLRGSGFRNVPLSPFAISQAKLLLRLHYPSEGYQLQMKNNSVFLGWQNRPLLFVSSWR
ncbi:hypothetical protein SAY87_010281 [Trapa incisa]|uniref:Scarecrow-like protein 18 n=1 Tax=Trapa incisa TaxID=236973 RepID=A0AAN7GTW2_9MYRT|nr:hypothetical protein SAY87_010281 [Trapa incisa]